MALSRQEIARLLRQTELEDAAANALATLPDQPDAKDIEQLCTSLPSLDTGLRAVSVGTASQWACRYR